MPKFYLSFVVLFLLALGFSACEKCEECSADLSARFRLVDSARTEILTDLSQLTIQDLEGNIYEAIRQGDEIDTFYLVDLAPLSLELESPDTLIMSYSNALIDTVDVGYSFSSDSRCCTNTFIVGRLTFFNRDAARRIRPNYSIYDVIIND